MLFICLCMMNVSCAGWRGECANVVSICSPVVDLLGLLKWRSNTSLLQQNLRHLMKVEGGEVVKVRVTLLTDRDTNLQLSSVTSVWIHADIPAANVNV